MKVLRDTPFEVGFGVYSFTPPQPSMVVVVKATFDLSTQPARLAESQVPIEGDVYEDDDPEAGLVYAADLVGVKPQGECYVQGHCYPAHPPAKTGAIHFQVGAVEKTIGVFGDRHWEPSFTGVSPSEPTPFTSMPLTWSRAYGGQSDKKNPLGLGRDPNARGERPLPNLEQMRAPIGSPDAHPTPICSAPYRAQAAHRLQFAGTYDQRWLDHNYPWLPDDFDPRYFLVAAEDQRIPGFWRGDETIVMRHLHPTIDEIRATLPGIHPRAFIERSDAAQSFEEVGLILDTIILRGDESQAVCLWRGTCNVHDLERSDVDTLFVMHEPIGADLSPDDYRARYHAWIAQSQVPQDAPANDGTGFDADAYGDDEDAEMSTIVDEQPPFAAEEWDGDDAVQRSDSANAAPVSEFVAALIAAHEEFGLPVPSILTDPTSPPPAEIPLPPPPAPPASTDALKAEFAKIGLAPPAVLLELVAEAAEPAADEADTPAPPASEPPVEKTVRERVLASHANGRALEGDLSAVDLAGLTLDGLQAPNACLQGMQAARASLAGANFEGALLEGAQLHGTNLKGTCFRNADLTGADLSKACLEGANFDGALLDDAVLQHIRASQATFRGASLRAAKLSAAFVEEACFDEADLSEACGPDLHAQGASFCDAQLHGANFDHADFRYTKLTNVRAKEGASFVETRFAYAVAPKSNWGSSNLERAVFSFADLTRADFSRANLHQATLDAATLISAVFSGAMLGRAELIRCNAMNATFRNADLSFADLRGANCYAAEFWQATLDETRLDQAIIAKTRLEES